MGPHVKSVTVNDCAESNASSPAQGYLYCIKGQVRDETGQDSIPHAMVMVSGQSTGGLCRSIPIQDTTWTNYFGFCWFKLPAGSYYIYRDWAVGKYDVTLPGSYVNDSLKGLDFVRATDVHEMVEPGLIPQAFTLCQNYPDPFNPQTETEFALPEPCHHRLDVWNILGSAIVTLVDQQLTAGLKRVLRDGRDRFASEVASGVYFYRIQAGTFSQVRKMVVLK